MKYYLIILFLISNFFLFTIFNVNTYGMEAAKVNYLNEFKNIPLIPIKAKILPQYDESIPQSINQVKSATDVKANDVKESSNSTESAPASMGIKILSPKNGKEIPDGNLTIFGTSTDSEKSNCSVSVDLNNQKPFQKAKATGPYGENDYSSWTFTYSPSYHTIENGINDLTSKLECVENSKVITKWHSINVTGVTTADAKPTSSLVFHDPLGILPQLKTVSTNPSTSNIEKSDNQTTSASDLSVRLQLLKDKMLSAESQHSTISLPVQKQLLVEASLLKDIVAPGDKQTIDIKVLDANNKQSITGADIMTNIGGKKISEKTDANGVMSYTWDTPATSGDNTYQINLDVSSKDYPKVMKAISFKMDKPQNLLEPPISNYVHNVLSANSNDLKNELDSQNKFQECTTIPSSAECSVEGKDKPVLNPTTDDKPALNPTTYDKPALNATADDKAVLNDYNENENIHNEKNQKVDNVFDFLAPVSK